MLLWPLCLTNCALLLLLQVRPELVLRRALQRLVGLLRSESSGVNWFYACDQFKGMRQDCTVQVSSGCRGLMRNACSVGQSRP